MALQSNDTLFIDTSYVVALVNTRDQYHKKALLLSDTYYDNPLVTSEAILLEIAGAFSARYKKSAINIIDSFLSSDDIVIVPHTTDLFSRAYTIYKRYDDKEWSLVDCMSFLIMRDMKIHAALTADSHFRQAGFDTLLG